jgi:hypothetical protein
MTAVSSLTSLDKLQPADAVVVAVAHRDYREAEAGELVKKLLKPEGGFIADVPAFLDRESCAAGRYALAALRAAAFRQPLYSGSQAGETGATLAG